jgi:hypothetical protein
VDDDNSTPMPPEDEVINDKHINDFSVNKNKKP